MKPYTDWFQGFQELYTKLQTTAKDKMGLDKLPFTLSALENPPGYRTCPNIYSFIQHCRKLYAGNDSDEQAKQLICFLQENTPEINYKNPVLPEGELSEEDWNLMEQIFFHGIDLPGSMHNPYGKPGYYSDLFFDIYFGNYTEFLAQIKSLSRKKLKTTLKRREGHCQFSIIFAPILGLRMLTLHMNPYLSNTEIQEIRNMYHGNNENKQEEILEKLLKLGADPNVHDINGYTPLNHALGLMVHRPMAELLLRYGADPNAESRKGERPLSMFPETEMGVLDMLIKANAKLNDKKQAGSLRSSAEAWGSKDLAVRVREALPRDQYECEKCADAASKKCAACNLVFYCSPACQKLDWGFHKVSCRNKRNDE